MNTSIGALSKRIVAVAALTGAALAGCDPAGAQAPPSPPSPNAPGTQLPTFAELEAAGATIGEIRVRVRDIFDTEDPAEDKLLFRWANALHIQTRPGVIERTLLFKSGEPVSVRLIDETERVLRTARYLYDVQIRPFAYHDGVVDIEVETRDTWTLEPSVSVGRTGGANTSSIRLNEYNLLGSGVTLGFARNKNIDRTSSEFSIANERAFGGSTALKYSQAKNSDGTRQAASVAHPFYALDTPWSGGISASKDNRIDAIYNAGQVVSQYRHRQNLADAFGGWSTGRVDGWVQRYSIGVSWQDDAYAPEPGLVAPAQLPTGDKLVAPYVRYELIEDRFQKLRNRNQIERPEYFAFGLATTLQLGRASSAFGSSRNAWLYSSLVSRGFEPAPEHTLIASAQVSGQHSEGRVAHHQLGGKVKYFVPQNKHWLFYASLSADTVKNPDPAEALLLGGDNGLRGYPLRYQSGERRVLLTLEERVYTDLYLMRLFRVGWAAFYDAGRAWAGPNVNTINPGWLKDVGLGLRIFSVRSAFSNVLHIDIAFPVDTDVNVKKMQYLVKTRASF